MTETVVHSAAPARIWAQAALDWADRYRFWLLGFVVIVLLAGFNGQWRIEPDSALYVSIARNLAEGQGYTYHGEPNALAYPGLPYVIAGTFKLFGVGVLWPAHMIMLLASLAGLGLIYRLFCLHAGRPTAVLVTCGVGLTRLFYRYGFYLLTEMPFLVGVLAFLAGYEAVWGGGGGASNRKARWYDWALMVGGLGIAAVMRPAMYGLLAAVGGAMLLALLRGRLPWRRAAVLVALLAALGAFLLIDPRRDHPLEMGVYESTALKMLGELGPTLRRAMLENLPQMLEEGPHGDESVVVSAVFGRGLARGLNTVAALAVLGLGLGLVRRRVLWGLWVAATLAMMLLMLPVQGLDPRYLLPVLPLLVYGWWLGIRWVNARLPGAWGNLAFAALLGLGIVPNLTRVATMVYEQHQSPFLEHYRRGRFVPLMEMAQVIAAESDRSAVVLAPYETARALTYFSRRHVFEAGEWLPGDLAERPLLVVMDEGDAKLRQMLEAHHVQVGALIAQVQRGKSTPLRLHEARMDRSAPGC